MAGGICGRKVFRAPLWDWDGEEKKGGKRIDAGVRTWDGLGPGKRAVLNQGGSCAAVIKKKKMQKKISLKK